MKTKPAAPTAPAAAKSRTKAKPTFEGYLAALPAEQRTALERLRRVIRAAVPAAEEYIGYGVPAFRLNGRFLVGLGAGASHCAFYPGAAVESFGDALKGYDTGRGTVRFAAGKPLPATLVRRLVKARLAHLARARANQRG